MIKSLLRKLIRTAGYREGLRRGKLTAEKQNAEIAQKNEEELARLKSTLVETYREIGQKEAEKQRQLGYEAGLSSGKSRGLSIGVAEGEAAGRAQAARNYGVIVSASTPEFNTDAEHIHWGPHPNVYTLPSGKIVVRVLHEGRVRKQTFGHGVRRRGRQGVSATLMEVQPANDVVQMFVESFAFRDSVSGGGDVWDAVYEEARQAVNLPVDSNASMSTYDRRIRQLAEEFHRRVQSSRSHRASAGMLGEDPEDRFDLEDKSLLERPWSTLFGVRPPRRIADALFHIGLGSPSRTSHCHPMRCVRDLLLVTAEELKEVHGVGDGTVADLRRHLSRFRIALAEEEITLSGRAVRQQEAPPTRTRGIYFTDDQ